MTYLCPKQAVQYLRQTFNISYSPSYLARLRCEGGGPIHTKLGNGRIYYQMKDLEAWIASRSHVRAHTAMPKPNRAWVAKFKGEDNHAAGNGLSRDYDIFALLEGKPG
ncbi:helix-turn-helix transcriptional regulator [Dinoroseobacter sp. S76]|uniref:helix-turn-helix transcriptional regulator n=1 Tax=Dinoroseobacter sp. S76 TaxID=3415124 RepID=UPI003C7EA689